MKEIKNFAVLTGNSQIKNGVIVHAAISSKRKSKQSSVATDEIRGSEVRSDTDFYNGIIEFKVKFKDANCGCLLVLNSLEENTIKVGISSELGHFVIPSDDGVQKIGRLANYDLSTDIDFKVEVTGSNIKLFINKVLIGQGNRVIMKSPITFRLSGSSVKLHDIKYVAEQPKIFIVMQFSEEFNILYKDVIKPVCESYELECVRADEFFTSSPILKDIIDSILNSSLIIAEITPDNPNVFYEIGYAHALNKPTIILCDRKRQKLPFDLSGFRTLFYENSIGGKNSVETSLRQYIEQIFGRK